MSFVEALLSSSYFIFPAVGGIAFLLTYLWSDKLLNWLYQRSIGQKETKELAVMIDPFNPVMVTEEALNIEVKDYYKSWLE